MLAIEPGARYECDEELRTISIFASVSHWQKVGHVVFPDEILVWEGPAVDGFAASAIVVREISTLGHEVGDDSMEMRSLISEAFGVCTKLSEVGGSLRDDVIEKLKDHFAAGLASCKVDFEEYIFESSCHQLKYQN